MDLARLIQIARGTEPADLLLTNARVLDLYACDVIPADVAIAGGRIAGIALPETDAYQARDVLRSEEHTSELQSHSDLVCRLLLEKKNEHVDGVAERAIMRT